MRTLACCRNVLVGKDWMEAWKVSGGEKEWSHFMSSHDLKSRRSCGSSWQQMLLLQVRKLEVNISICSFVLLHSLHLGFSRNMQKNKHTYSLGVQSFVPRNKQSASK